MPTVYLTCLASISSQTPGAAGPGRVLGIMRHPGAAAREASKRRTVLALTPRERFALMAKREAWSLARYALELLPAWGCADLSRPAIVEEVDEGLRGVFGARPWDGGWWALADHMHDVQGPHLADGDTAFGVEPPGHPCHRRVAAPLLARSGWDVVLDGERLPARRGARWVLVCGSRDGARVPFARVAGVLEALSMEDGVGVVVHGACGCDRIFDESRLKGVDGHAHRWARRAQVPVLGFPADWSAGGADGPLRNRMMAQVVAPDLVVAFPGGLETKSMVAEARRAGVQVYFPDGEP